MHRSPRFSLLLLLALAAGAAPAAAQQRHTPNTFALDPDAPRPSATLADVAWIAGHWQGEALGGRVEEVWAPPMGGTMMGMYKLVNGDSIVFYELMTVVEEAGSVTLRLKHFNPDLSGWEEKDASVSFPLVGLEPGALYFDGLSFQRLDPDTLRVYLAIGGRDGSVREEVFDYRRVHLR